MASLYLYFDRLYEPQKINNMIKAINDFTSSAEDNQWTNEKLYSEVSKFMKKQNATMSIQPMTNLYSASAIVISRETIEPSPDFLILNNERFNNKWLNQIPTINNKELDFSQTLNITKALPMYNPMNYATLNLSSQYSIGTATNINGSVVFYPVVAQAAIKIEDNIEVYEKNGINFTISTIPYTDYRQVNFTKENTLNGENIVTNVNLSLQSVNEVKNFLISSFPFLIGVAIILSFIMVIVYSRTISKPIVSITNTANRMANMELGIASNINRKDELGALSTSLNTLSTNLKIALDDLSFANEQLKSDYENERKQEKARKEFVANVSHELKTPLGIIKSYTEGIRDGVKAEKKDYYIEVILDEITRMDQMIIEMLEISKFDAGVVTYKKEPVDFNILLDKVLRIYIEKAHEKEVTFDTLGKFGEVYIDKEKIERVLNNLIGNAVKYCNPNSIIKIRGERAKKTLTIYIENDCRLFTEEALSKIWDRFYKADTSHNRDMEGTGLGLSIAKSILLGHGCSYGVKNTVHGICFHFSLDTEKIKHNCALNDY
jgi:signal transduction histidine kinase